MNNTKNQPNKQDQNGQQGTRVKHGPKKQGQNPKNLQDQLGNHEQEHPETRLTR